VLALMTVLPDARNLFPRDAVFSNNGVEHLLLLQPEHAIPAAAVVNLLREVYHKCVFATTTKTAAAPPTARGRLGELALRTAGRRFAPSRDERALADERAQNASSVPAGANDQPPSREVPAVGASLRHEFAPPSATPPRPLRKALTSVLPQAELRTDLRAVLKAGHMTDGDRPRDKVGQDALVHMLRGRRRVRAPPRGRARSHLLRAGEHPLRGHADRGGRQCEPARGHASAAIARPHGHGHHCRHVSAVDARGRTGRGVVRRRHRVHLSALFGGGAAAQGAIPARRP
jgi:hypothetical protein